MPRPTATPVPRSIFIVYSVEDAPSVKCILGVFSSHLLAMRHVALTIERMQRTRTDGALQLVPVPTCGADGVDEHCRWSLQLDGKPCCHATIEQWGVDRGLPRAASAAAIAVGEDQPGTSRAEPGATVLAFSPRRG